MAKFDDDDLLEKAWDFLSDPVLSSGLTSAEYSAVFAAVLSAYPLQEVLDGIRNTAGERCEALFVRNLFDQSGLTPRDIAAGDELLELTISAALERGLGSLELH